MASKAQLLKVLGECRAHPRQAGVPRYPRQDVLSQAPAPLRPLEGEQPAAHAAFCVWLMLQPGSQAETKVGPWTHCHRAIEDLFGVSEAWIRRMRVQWRWEDRQATAGQAESERWGFHLLRQVYPTVVHRQAFALLPGIATLHARAGLEAPEIPPAVAAEEAWKAGGDVPPAGYGADVAAKRAKKAKATAGKGKRPKPDRRPRRLRKTQEDAPAEPAQAEQPAPTATQGPVSEPERLAPPALVAVPPTEPRPAQTPRGAPVKPEAQVKPSTDDLILKTIQSGLRAFARDLLAEKVHLSAADFERFVRLHQLLTGGATERLEVAGLLGAGGMAPDTVRVAQARRVGGDAALWQAILEDATELQAVAQIALAAAEAPAQAPDLTLVVAEDAG